MNLATPLSAHHTPAFRLVFRYPQPNRNHVVWRPSTKLNVDGILISKRSTDALLLDSTFEIKTVTQKKYDRVARMTGERDDLRFTLDYNCEIYTVNPGDTVQLAIASTLSLDGSIANKEAEAARGGWRDTQMGEATLADNYDYVCYGKMYRFEESPNDQM